MFKVPYSSNGIVITVEIHVPATLLTKQLNTTNKINRQFEKISSSLSSSAQLTGDGVCRLQTASEGVDGIAVAAFLWLVTA